MRTFKTPILKSLLFAALVTATLTAGTGVAHAAFITDTTTFSFNGNTTPYNLSLNSFNPALGTLTGISLTLVTNLTPQVQLLNLTTSGQPFTNAQSTATFTLNGPGSTAVTATASTGSIDGTASAGMYTISTFSGSTVNQTQIIDLSPAIWAQYQGAGPLSFQAALGPYTSSASFTPGTLAVGGNGLVNGDVTIAYAYAPVPLPATFLLFGSGLAGLAAVRKRLKK
jgi:hypothetical protein